MKHWCRSAPRPVPLFGVGPGLLKTILPGATVQPRLKPLVQTYQVLAQKVFSGLVHKTELWVKKQTPVDTGSLQFRKLFFWKWGSHLKGFMLNRLLPQEKVP